MTDQSADTTPPAPTPDTAPPRVCEWKGVEIEPGKPTPDCKCAACAAASVPKNAMPHPEEFFAQALAQAESAREQREMRMIRLQVDALGSTIGKADRYRAAAWFLAVNWSTLGGTDSVPSHYAVQQTRIFLDTCAKAVEAPPAAPQT